MRILSVVCRRYYGASTGVEPMFHYFSLPLRSLGHRVDSFDHYEAAATLGRERATDALIQRIADLECDVVFYQTGQTEPVDTARLGDLSRRTALIAWNSDDDWQWGTTRIIAPHFTWMATTYPSIYRAHKAGVPNLILSQWGCMAELNRSARPKDIPFSFAGAAYRIRNQQCRWLRKNAGLACFGRGARLANWNIPYFRGAFRLPWLAGGAIDFTKINDIWGRSRVSYTPLEGGPRGEVLSLKSRIFDMGLSGTLMLCQRAPDLELYYEPDREFEAFSTLEECADKARYYLAHEAERAAIADRYRKRTQAEHLWTHRFQRLFRDAGLGTS